MKEGGGLVGGTCEHCEDRAPSGPRQDSVRTLSGLCQDYVRTLSGLCQDCQDRCGRSTNQVPSAPPARRAFASVKGDLASVKGDHGLRPRARAVSGLRPSARAFSLSGLRPRARAGSGLRPCACAFSLSGSAPRLASVKGDPSRPLSSRCATRS